MKLSASVSRIRSYLHNAYAIDTRSLALFRIAVGLVVLADLLRRFQHSTALYSDVGVLQRRDAISSLSPSRWSLLFANGSPEFVKAFIVVGIISAIAFILGWGTRLAAVILWIVVISVQVRNVGVNDGSDNLIRVTLFWAMFLPLGRIWSLDSMNEGTDRQSKAARLMPIASLAAFGLLLQQSYMYWFTAMLKEGPRWTEDSSALYFALGMGHVNNGFGEWLFQNSPSWILESLTIATLIVEYAIPIMLLLPVMSAFLRTIAVFLIVSLHLGILSMMQVELFPLISIASATGMLPAAFWDSILPRASSVMARVLRHPIPSLRTGHAAQGGELAFYPSAEGGKSNKLHFMPQTLTGALNGKTIVTLICGFAIVLTSLSNLSNVSSYTMPSSLNSIALSAGLQQSWRMFAPQPGANTVWYVIEGEVRSGESVDLLLPVAENDMSIKRAPVWDQSNEVLYPSKFWRKYLTSIRNRDSAKRHFAYYACDNWNEVHSENDRLIKVNIFRGTSRTLPDSERAEPVFTDLGSWNCT